MLSMVNANRFISKGAIPLVLVAYANAHHSHEDPDVRAHLQNVQNSRVDAVVFGGSNAVYCLSAEDLSNRTGLSWYNASLDGELLSVDKHKNFVRELSARIDRAKVRYVVYSSLFPYVIGRIGLAKRGYGEGIKPSLSVLHDIEQNILQVNLGDVDSERQRDSFGDIVFETVQCKLVQKKPWHEREDVDASADFLVDEAIFYTSVFPNASIFIVLPSEYYGVARFDDSIFEQNLRTKFYGLLRQKYHFEGMVKIIFQPPYPSIMQVDNQRHANEDGRVWRTKNLIESIQPTISRRRGFVHEQVNHL